MPTVRTIDPATGNHLYLPIRLVARPAAIEVTMTPAIIGSISRPLFVGDAPLTICRYSGMKMIDPNITRPRMKPAALARAKVRRRNSFSGRIGSLARLSWNRKETANSAPAPNSDRIVREPQAYSLPPQDRASSKQLTPATMSAAPSQSITWSRRWNGISRMTREQTMIARMPIGTLM